MVRFAIRTLLLAEPVSLDAPMQRPQRSDPLDGHRANERNGRGIQGHRQMHRSGVGSNKNPRAADPLGQLQQVRRGHHPSPGIRCRDDRLSDLAFLVASPSDPGLQSPTFPKMPGNRCVTLGWPNLRWPPRTDIDHPPMLGNGQLSKLCIDTRDGLDISGDSVLDRRSFDAQGLE